MWGMAVVLASPSVIAATADATAAGFDWSNLIGSAITPVAVVVALLSGWLHTRADYDRVVKESSAKDEVIADKDRQLTAFQTGVIEKAIPALTRVATVLEGLDGNRYRHGDG